jgi:hypothetical protein
MRAISMFLSEQTEGNPGMLILSESQRTRIAAFSKTLFPKQ